MIRWKITEIEANPRQKTRLLSELFKLETQNSNLIRQKGSSPFTKEQDLDICINIASELSILTEQQPIEENIRQRIVSRIIHFGTRVARLDPVGKQLANKLEQCLNKMLEVESRMPPRSAQKQNRTRQNVSFAPQTNTNDAVPADDMRNLLEDARNVFQP